MRINWEPVSTSLSKKPLPSMAVGLFLIHFIITAIVLTMSDVDHMDIMERSIFPGIAWSLTTFLFASAGQYLRAQLVFDTIPTDIEMTLKRTLDVNKELVFAVAGGTIISTPLYVFIVKAVYSDSSIWTSLFLSFFAMLLALLMFDYMIATEQKLLSQWRSNN